MPRSIIRASRSDAQQGLHHLRWSQEQSDVLETCICADHHNPDGSRWPRITTRPWRCLGTQTMNGLLASRWVYPRCGLWRATAEIVPPSRCTDPFKDLCQRPGVRGLATNLKQQPEAFAKQGTRTHQLRGSRGEARAPGRPVRLQRPWQGPGRGCCATSRRPAARDRLVDWNRNVSSRWTVPRSCSAPRTTWAPWWPRGGLQQVPEAHGRGLPDVAGGCRGRLRTRRWAAATRHRPGR